MAIRQIQSHENPVLREKAKLVTEFDQKLHYLIDDMIDTMLDANGVGLAAPQIGILKRVALVCDKKDNIVELINPVITFSKGTVVANEGCLSIKGQSAYVARPKKVTVEAQDRFGKKFSLATTDSLMCAAISHELDHLDGILYIDKTVEPPASAKRK